LTTGDSGRFMAPMLAAGSGGAFLPAGFIAFSFDTFRCRLCSNWHSTTSVCRRAPGPPLIRPNQPPLQTSNFAAGRAVRVQRFSWQRRRLQVAFLVLARTCRPDGHRPVVAEQFPGRNNPLVEVTESVGCFNGHLPRIYTQRPANHLFVGDSVYGYTQRQARCSLCPGYLMSK